MRKTNRSKRPTGLRYSDLVDAFESVRTLQRQHGIAHDVVERMLRDTEDGLAAGLPCVPLSVPQRYKLDIYQRAELMESLTMLSRAFSTRALEAQERVRVLKEAA